MTRVREQLATIAGEFGDLVVTAERDGDVVVVVPMPLAKRVRAVLFIVESGMQTAGFALRALLAPKGG